MKNLIDFIYDNKLNESLSKGKQVSLPKFNSVDEITEFVMEKGKKVRDTRDISKPLNGYDIEYKLSLFGEYNGRNIYIWFTYYKDGDGFFYGPDTVTVNFFISENNKKPVLHIGRDATSYKSKDRMYFSSENYQYSFHEQTVQDFFGIQVTCTSGDKNQWLKSLNDIIGAIEGGCDLYKVIRM